MRRTIGALTALVAVGVITSLGSTAVAGPGDGSADNGGASRAEKHQTGKHPDGKFADFPYTGFTGDSTGSKPNGFVSNDTAYIAFSDPGDADLRVNDYGSQSFGNGLHNGDFHGGIQLDFAKPTTGLYMYFGNDDPGWMPAGSKARLTGYYKGKVVGRTSVEVNRNDTMDQYILLNAPLMDRAVIEYVDGAGNLTDNGPIVDAIQLNPLCTKVGNNGNNKLVGTAGDDVLCGGQGNDKLDGRGGEDYLYGGPGADTILGGGGADVAYGGDGNDTIKGGGGGDTLNGQKGKDKLTGGGGYDYCYGGPGKDSGVCEVSISVP